MSTQLIQSYISMCLDSKIAHLFNDTITGVQYWRNNRNRTCYKCRKKGHLAKQCGKICPYCQNYHPGLPVCLSKIYKYIEKIYSVLTKKNKDNLILKYEKLCKEEKKLQDELQGKQMQKINGLKNKINKEEKEQPKKSLKIKRKSNNFNFFEDNDSESKRNYDENENENNKTRKENDSNKDEREREEKERIKNKKKDEIEIINAELLRLKLFKWRIQHKTGFQSHIILRKINKINDFSRVIKNLELKENDLRERIEDMYVKLGEKKTNLKKIKNRMNNIDKEKNRMLNSARVKGEKIKLKAMKAYNAFVCKKNSKQKWVQDSLRKTYDKIEREQEEKYNNLVNDMEDERYEQQEEEEMNEYYDNQEDDQEEEEYIDEENEEEYNEEEQFQGMDKDYKKGVYDMFEDGKMGNYKEDDDFNEFYGNLGS